METFQYYSYSNRYIVVDISGWTVYLQQLMLGQNGVVELLLLMDGATPIDSTPTPSNPNNQVK